MGTPVSKETIYKYVIENYEVAYNYSDTFYDFKNYFRKHALDNRINLDNEINNESLNEVLDCLIDNFKIRKKKDNESKEMVERSEKNYREMHENLLHKFQLELERNKIANKNREENLQKVIYELQKKNKN